MKIIWDITENDINKVKKFVADNESPFVRKRRARNIKKEQIVIDKDKVIKSMLMCLLTSQQRSGPNSVVGQFLRKTPFPITIETLSNTDNPETYLWEILNNNDVKRYINKISKYFSSNYKQIQDEKWSILNDLQELNLRDSKAEERLMADKLSEKFKGFGPKQARNFLQVIGLTKYELPIDSRIMSWLNDFGFPVKLNSKQLSDKYYYHLVSDGIQELCKKSGIFPSILDAAIFSSFDNNEWTEENTIS